MIYSNLFPSLFHNNTHNHSRSHSPSATCRTPNKLRGHRKASSFPDLPIEPLPPPPLPLRLESPYQPTSRMGQQQTKQLANNTGSSDRAVHPAFASDPFYGPGSSSRPQSEHYLPVHSPISMPEPPHSAPMNFIPTDQTFTHIEYNPGGALPLPARRSVSTRRKTLARKLSQKTGRKTSIADFRPGTGSGTGSGIWSGGSNTPKTTKRERDLDDEMREFEALVAEAESRVGIEPLSSGSVKSSGKTAKVSSFTASRTKRLSLTESRASAPASGSLSALALPLGDRPSPNSIPFPTHTRPSPPHHNSRRLSSSSTQSRRISTTSAGRAEREWRAKVASLAHIMNTAQSQPEDHHPIGHRGPVPPKRTPGPRRPSAESSETPHSDAIVTPRQSPNVLVDSVGRGEYQYPRGTPAKSFISNRSFETLGHYPSSSPVGRESHNVVETTPRADLNMEVEVRDRKASVPYSITSFYLDPAATAAASRVGASRPPSFATTHLLGNTVPQDSSPLSKYSTRDVEDDDMDVYVDVKNALLRRQIHRVSLPPFESFHISPPQSPRSPTSTISRQPAREDQSRPDSEPVLMCEESDLSGVDQMTTISDETSTVEAVLKVAIRRDAREGIQSLAAKRLSLSPKSFPQPIEIHALTSTSPTIPALEQLGHSSSYRYPSSLHPIPASPTYSPTTPLSPTSNYIMTAPIDSISWSTSTPSPEDKRRSHIPHPFAVGISNSTHKHHSAPPTPPSKSPRAARSYPSLATLRPAPPQPRMLPRPDSAVEVSSIDPFLDTPTAHPTAPTSGGKASKTASRRRDQKQKEKCKDKLLPTILQVRRSQPRMGAPGLAKAKAVIVGHDGVDELRRQREKLKRMGVDLTPGMEDGARPPKSGLPVDDLERWLMQTSLAA